MKQNIGISELENKVEKNMQIEQEKEKRLGKNEEGLRDTGQHET